MQWAWCEGIVPYPSDLAITRHNIIVSFVCDRYHIIIILCHIVFVSLSYYHMCEWWLRHSHFVQLYLLGISKVWSNSVKRKRRPLENKWKINIMFFTLDHNDIIYNMNIFVSQQLSSYQDKIYDKKCFWDYRCVCDVYEETGNSRISWEWVFTFCEFHYFQSINFYLLLRQIHDLEIW